MPTRTRRAAGRTPAWHLLHVYYTGGTAQAVTFTGDTDYAIDQVSRFLSRHERVDEVVSVRVRNGQLAVLRGGSRALSSRRAAPGTPGGPGNEGNEPADKQARLTALLGAALLGGTPLTITVHKNDAGPRPAQYRIAVQAAGNEETFAIAEALSEIDQVAKVVVTQPGVRETVLRHGRQATVLAGEPPVTPDGLAMAAEQYGLDHEDGCACRLTDDGCYARALRDAYTAGYQACLAAMNPG